MNLDDITCPQFADAVAQLKRQPKRWCVTGAAGFIGSNLVELLLDLGQTVVALDNFSTGHQRNLDEVQANVGPDAWTRFAFLHADIVDFDKCCTAVDGVDYVLHQAALGSVPRSINDPLATNEANITGFLNMLHAAKEASCARFVYAASSSTYGTSPDLPKVESVIGEPLSPYAVTKYVNELYARNYTRVYDFSTVGLRYFNVFGRRQDPNGAYAAVIPNWFNAFLRGEPLFINGDGETTRDFTYIDNVLRMNILAALGEGVDGEVFNVAVGQRASLNQLFVLVREQVAAFRPLAVEQTPQYNDFRAGDVRHSLASIEKARRLLGYEPVEFLEEGLARAAPWYHDFFLSQG